MRAGGHSYVTHSQNRLTITLDGDVAFAHSFNRLTGTEVAVLVYVPLVVLLGEHSTDQTNDCGAVREGLIGA